jgi:hypothetical protein
MNDTTISRRNVIRTGGLAAIAAVLPAVPVAAAPELSPALTTWLVGRPEIAATLAVLPPPKTVQLGGLIDGSANILDTVAYPEDDDTEA